jgi:hypothetical protein
MPNKTSRAKAQPIHQHPDAAIFALAEQCAAAVKAIDKAMPIFDQAEARCRHLATPPVIIRTEKDKQLGFYVGNRAGTAYGREDVPILRALVRRYSIAHAASDFDVWQRACDILEALRDLKKEEAREGFESGLTEATRSYYQAQDAYEELTERLARMVATTMEGALAKARAMRRTFIDDDQDLGEQIAGKLKEHMRRLGPDEDALAISLAHDLIQLADKAAA